MLWHPFSKQELLIIQHSFVLVILVRTAHPNSFHKCSAELRSVPPWRLFYSLRRLFLEVLFDDPVGESMVILEDGVLEPRFWGYGITTDSRISLWYIGLSVSCQSNICDWNTPDSTETTCCVVHTWCSSMVSGCGYVKAGVVLWCQGVGSLDPMGYWVGPSCIKFFPVQYGCLSSPVP